MPFSSQKLAASVLATLKKLSYKKEELVRAGQGILGVNTASMVKIYPGERMGKMRTRARREKNMKEISEIGSFILFFFSRYDLNIELGPLS